MMEFFERMTHLAEHAVSSIKVSSALNSCLWLSALAIPVGFGVAVLSNGPVQAAGLVLAFTPIVLFSIGFLYFMIKSPEKLRSEEYELRKIALTLIEEKGGQIAISETSVEAIANSDYKELPKLQAKGDME